MTEQATELDRSRGTAMRAASIRPSFADRTLFLLAAILPSLAFGLLALAILAGLLFTLLPAFGWLPALGGHDLSLAPFRALLAEPGIGRSAALSFATGLAASALSLLLVMLFLAGFAGTKFFERLRWSVAPLLALPHAAAAFGLAFLFAPSGMAARLVSPELTGWTAPPDWLIVNDPSGLFLTFSLAAKEIPFLLLVALAALPQAEAAPRRMLAASLGYGRMAGFLSGTWPPLYRQMRLGVFAVLAFATSVVDMAAILGPAAPPTLGLKLLAWANDPDLSHRFTACAGALLQLGVSAAALLAWIGLERIFGLLRDRLAFAGCRLPHDRWIRRAAATMLLAALAALSAGLLILLLWSLAGPWSFPDAWPAALTLQTWARLAPRLGAPLADTLLIGGAAAAIALVLAVLTLHRGDRTGTGAGAGLLLALPLLLPQASFLFGLQLLFLLAGFSATRSALVLAHLVFVLPYAMLALAPAWEAFDRRFEQLAAGLGHGPARTLLSVRLPMLLPAVLGAAAIGFAVSVGLYLPTVLIGAGRISTVTTEAVALASGSNRRVIGVFAFLQMLLPWAAFAVALAWPAWHFRDRRGMRA